MGVSHVSRVRLFIHFICNINFVLSVYLIIGTRIGLHSGLKKQTTWLHSLVYYSLAMIEYIPLFLAFSLGVSPNSLFGA